LHACSCARHRHRRQQALLELSKAEGRARAGTHRCFAGAPDGIHAMTIPSWRNLRDVLAFTIAANVKLKLKQIFHNSPQNTTDAVVQ
jgi:hypothetical protein